MGPSIVVGVDFYHIIRTFCSDLGKISLIRALGDFFCQEPHLLHAARLFFYLQQRSIAFDFIGFIAFQLNDILLFGAGRTNGRQTLSSVDSVVVTADEPFRDSPKEWFLKRSKKHQNYEDDGDPNFVFHVLDSVIVGTMERLKKLRFGLSILVYYRFKLCDN